MSSVPRPVRFIADANGRFLRDAVPEALRGEFAKPYTDALLVGLMADNVPTLRRAMALAQANGDPPQIMSLMATELTFQIAGGVIVELTPALIEQLLNTDLDAAEVMTAQDLRLPFDGPIFLRAPSNAPALMVSGHDLPLPLDGFYLRRTHVELDTASVDGLSPGIYDGIDIVCLSQPIVSSDPLDDAYFHCPLAWSASDQQTTVRTIIEQRHQQMAGADPARRQHYRRLMDEFESLLTFVLKALLYLNLPEARRRSVNEATDLAKRLRGLGPKKQARLARQAARAYDRVEVGPTAEEFAAAAAVAGHRTVAPHWRRGHFRRQRIGEGRTQSRIVWIKPVLVAFNADIGSAAPTPKNYRVAC